MTVFHPPHPNNMTDTSASGVAVGEDDTASPGEDDQPADGEPVGGWTGDQDDLPDFNTLGDKTSPS